MRSHSAELDRLATAVGDSQNLPARNVSKPADIRTQFPTVLLSMTTTDSSNGADRKSFLEGLRLSDLLTPRQFEVVVAELPASIGSAKDVAEKLIDTSVLTRFQAELLLSGRTDGFVIGQYVVQEYMGRGPNGRMYKARHRTMNRSVCIHVLSSELTRLPADREAVRNYSRLIAQLVNLHVVTLLDVNEVGERMYLVTEHIDGASGHALVNASGPLDWRMACDVVRQTALGLQHAHDRGVIHSRITAESIIVGKPGGPSTHGRPVVKLGNFCLGLMTDEPADRLASYAFRAPEQFTSPNTRDQRSDIYSLGCVLFLLLTGRTPFTASTPEELPHLHLYGTIPCSNHLRPDLPASVAGLIVAMLAKNPLGRPTAHDIAAGLEKVLDGKDNAGVIDFSKLPPSYAPPGEDSARYTASPSMAATDTKATISPASKTVLLSATEAALPDDAIRGRPVSAPTLAATGPSERTPVMTQKQGSQHDRSSRTKTRKRRNNRKSSIHPIFVFALMGTVAISTVLVLLWLIKQFGG